MSSRDDNLDAFPLGAHYSPTEAGAGINESEPNLRPTPKKKEPLSYNLEGWKLAIIFNQYKFESRFEYPDRDGTEHDVESITNTFEAIGWNVETYNDLTVEGIRKVMEDVSDVQDYSALAIFILSHGASNNIIMASDNYYNLKDTIIDALKPDNCPGLRERPKLIFIQVKL